MKRLIFMRTCVAAAAVVVLCTSAHADGFEFGDGWTGSWSGSVSLGSSWRARDPDKRLYGQANGALVGKTDGQGANTIDEGNLNYRRGDRYTTMLKTFGEVEVKKGDMGALVRAKAWYDQALMDRDVRFGNQNNGYNGYDAASDTLAQPRPLSDKGFEKLSRFKGVYLLDAYAYDTFDVAGLPMQVRAGNQVVNWGESLFIQGINQINPIDVPSFRKPGAQLKEVFLPVPILDISQSLGQYGSVEAFWQAQWKNTPVEASCGNYWSVAAATISYKATACDNAVALPGFSNPAGHANNAYVPNVAGRKARDGGEFGLAYRVNSEALDTEFGLYAMQLHSRLPVVSIQKKTPSAANLSSIESFWEYPEDIKHYGLSASTNILGWSVGAEISHSRDVPVQVDGNDLLLAGLAAGGTLAPLGIAAGSPFGPYGQAAAAAFAGDGYLPGYTRANKTQLQLNTVKAGNRVLGASQYLLVGEVGIQTNNLPDYKSDPTALRYNRPFIFGAGSHDSYGGTTCNTLNISAQGCRNDGYISRSAWGYRLKGELTYTDLLPGITVYPGVYWAHDVKGYSLDNQFVEGRKTLALSLRMSYAKRYSLEMGAVTYARGATYDPLRDRESFYANGSIGF